MSPHPRYHPTADVTQYSQTNFPCRFSVPPKPLRAQIPPPAGSQYSVVFSGERENLPVGRGYIWSVGSAILSAAIHSSPIETQTWVSSITWLQDLTHTSDTVTLRENVSRQGRWSSRTSSINRNILVLGASIREPFFWTPVLKCVMLSPSVLRLLCLVLEYGKVSR